MTTREFAVLDMILQGQAPPRYYRFETAYLIAIKMLSYSNGILLITEKGRDEHEFYNQPGKRQFLELPQASL